MEENDELTPESGLSDIPEDTESGSITPPESTDPAAQAAEPTQPRAYKLPRKPPSSPRTGRPAGVRDVTPRAARNYTRPPVNYPLPAPGTATPAVVAAPYPQPSGIHPSALTTKPIPNPKHNKLRSKDFFEYSALVEAVAPSRQKIYVYRIWPVTDRKAHGLKNNIDILNFDENNKFDFDNWEDEFLRKYGSGDYKLIMNAFDPVIGRERPYCEARIEKLRDPDYPPVLDYNHLILNDPDNKAYIEKLKQQQILTLDGKPAGANGVTAPTPAQNEDEAQMSTVVEKAMDMTADQVRAANERAAAAERENADLRASIRRMEERLSSIQTTAPAVIDQGAITQQFLGTVLDGFKRTGEAMDAMRSKELERTGKMADPLTMLKETADLMKTFQGGAGEGQALAMQLLQIVISQSQAHSSEMAKIVEAISNRAAPPPTKSLVETVTELRAIKDAMSDAPGQQVDMTTGDDGEYRPRHKQHWSEILIPMLAPLVAPLLQRVMGGGQPQGYPPGYPQPGYPQQLPPGYQPQPQQAYYPPPPQPGMQPQPPQAPQMPSTDGGYQQLHELLAHFQGPILQAMNTGQTGEEFADWICQGYGVMKFMQFKQIGFQNIWTAITTYPPLWSQIGPMEVPFQAWLQDVLAFDPNQQIDDPDEPPPAAATGPRPVGVPASARPANSYTSPAVSTMMGT